MKKTLLILTANHLLFVLFLVLYKFLWLHTQGENVAEVSDSSASLLINVYGMSLFPLQLLVELVFVLRLAYLVIINSAQFDHFYAWSACLASGGLVCWFTLVPQ